MFDLERHTDFRDCLNNINDDYAFDALLIGLCERFGWTEDQIKNTSVDFIIRCSIYLEEQARKAEREQKRNNH